MYTQQYERARRGAEWASSQRQQYEQRAGGSRSYGGNREAPPKQSKYKGDPFADLGINKNASYREARAAYMREAKKHHPDMGGDPEKMKQVNNAWEEIQKHIKRDVMDSLFDACVSVWAHGFTPRYR